MTLRRRTIAAWAVLASVAALLTSCGPETSSARQGRPADDDVQVLVAFGLRRDDAALEQLVEEVSDPAGRDHLGFLSPEQLRDRFGASADTVREARRRLEASGIEGAALDTTGAVLVAQVTADQARAALQAPLVVQERADGSAVVAPERDPSVPAGLRGPITEVVGLTATLRPAAAAAVGPLVRAADVDPGCADSDIASATSVTAMNQHLGTQALYDAGHDGSGTTIALWAVEQFDPTPVRAFESCRQSPMVIPELTDVALTPPAPSGEEVTLDVIMAGWTAPGADLVVVRFDPYASLVFPLVRTMAAGEERTAPVDLLATSITVCESALPGPELAVAEHLLMGLAAMGTTTIAAAGDHGVAGCWPGDDEPAAAYPASSPFVTAVGGTSLVRDGDRIVDEAAWRDETAPSAGGGGTSDHFAVPDFQRSAQIGGSHRGYPDIASLAAVDRINAIPICDPSMCTWGQLGGTSAVAPALAGSLAVALSASREAGGAERVGWLNPQLAAWADDPRGPLTDITAGTTALLGNRCCTARPGWDSTSGWGSVTGFDRVAAEFAAQRPAS